MRKSISPHLSGGEEKEKTSIRVTDIWLQNIFGLDEENLNSFNACAQTLTGDRAKKFFSHLSTVVYLKIFSSVRATRRNSFLKMLLKQSRINKPWTDSIDSWFQLSITEHHLNNCSISLIQLRCSRSPEQESFLVGLRSGRGSSEARLQILLTINLIPFNSFVDANEMRMRRRRTKDYPKHTWKKNIVIRFPCCIEQVREAINQ